MSEKEGKALKISPRPERKAPATADEFVTGKEATKRLTFDIPEALHRRVKSGAAQDGKTVADIIREFLEQRFPVR